MILKRTKTDLDNKIQEQEEELDDQAGTIQQLEQTKLRLEMAQEKLRQTHTRELEEKEQELEEMRASTQKKVGASFIVKSWVILLFTPTFSDL